MSDDELPPHLRDLPPGIYKSDGTPHEVPAMPWDHMPEHEIRAMARALFETWDLMERDCLVPPADLRVDLIALEACTRAPADVRHQARDLIKTFTN